MATPLVLKNTIKRKNGAKFNEGIIKIGWKWKTMF